MEKPNWMASAVAERATYRVTSDALKAHQIKHSFRTKELARGFVNGLLWPWEMPWRKEQREVIECFFAGNHDEIIVQAIFGGGKTTMMLAIVFMLCLHDPERVPQVFICAFNIGIKNEIKKKTRPIGRFRVKTFDSLIYSCCAELGYEDLRLLNFEAKRRFVRENLDRLKPDESIRYVFIDETQDLERQCYPILKTLFPRARFMFVGDVFQSIQKEPRESLMWYFLNRLTHDSQKVYRMMDTPRVPVPILNEIKEALVQYYPEFQTTIDRWHSSSRFETTTRISWESFATYKSVYKRIAEKLEVLDPKDTMVLTFSSAITVRGNLGDVARFRRFLQRSGYELNLNHKRMQDDRLFLTTANSSKGLERKHVLCVLTFPLELAFANFSNDLVMNLITVALSRCKEDITFFVPTHVDRFSKVLDCFSSCPRPKNAPAPETPAATAVIAADASEPCEEECAICFEVHTKGQSITLECGHIFGQACIERWIDTKTSNKKCPKCRQETLQQKKKNKKVPRPLKDANVFDYDPTDMLGMLQKEHSVTEVLRQSILRFETRQILLRYCRSAVQWDLPASKIEGIRTEEDCALAGLLFESLILSLWTGRFPDSSFSTINHHTVFAEHLEKIRKCEREYRGYCRRYGAGIPNETARFKGAFMYARLHLFAHQKIWIHSDQVKNVNLYRRWQLILPAIRGIVIQGARSIKTQVNAGMPLLKGIMDAVRIPTTAAAGGAEDAPHPPVQQQQQQQQQNERMDIFEIKASRSSEWKEATLLQAMLYGIMNGKAMFNTYLINVFGKQARLYKVYLKKDLAWLRSVITQEVLNWNVNCFLAKNIHHAMRLWMPGQTTLKASKTILVEGRRDPFTGEWCEFCVCEFISITKTRFILLQDRAPPSVSGHSRGLETQTQSQEASPSPSPSPPPSPPTTSPPVPLIDQLRQLLEKFRTIYEVDCVYGLPTLMERVHTLKLSSTIKPLMPECPSSSWDDLLDVIVPERAESQTMVLNGVSSADTMAVAVCSLVHSTEYFLTD